MHAAGDSESEDDGLDLFLDGAETAGEEEDDGASLEEPLFEEGEDVSDYDSVDEWLQNPDNFPDVAEGEAGFQEDAQRDSENAPKRRRRRGEPPDEPPDEPPGSDDEAPLPPPPHAPGERPARRGGAERARALPRPVEMCKAEWEKHRREGHVNYHPGCKHCVKSRAVADQHRRVGEDHGHEEGDDDRLPTIAADLCFLGSEADTDKMTCLVMADGKSKLVFAHASPDKALVRGEHSAYMIAKIIEDINSLG